jgi:hypothetical protein
MKRKRQIAGGKIVANQKQIPRDICPDRSHHFIQLSTLDGALVIVCTNCGENRTVKVKQ